MKPHCYIESSISFNTQKSAQRMREHAKAIARPHAAHDVLQVRVMAHVMSLQNPV